MKEWLLYPIRDKGLARIIWFIARTAGKIRLKWFFKIISFLCHRSLFGFRSERIK